MTEKTYSKEWIDFMQKEKDFRKAVGYYNQNIALETQKKDILLALENIDGQSILTRLMSEGYICSEAIAQVWEKLVYLVFYGNVSVASWSVAALKKIDSSKRNRYRDEISRLVLLYADENKEDDISLMFGLQLLEKMGNKESINEYIERFGTYIDIDEEDILHCKKV